MQALDGRNGQLLWSYDRSHHEVFALNCQRDIDGDRVPDCLTGGRGGVSCKADAVARHALLFSSLGRLSRQSADEPAD